MAAKLRALAPTPEEVAAATKILEANGDKKAREKVTRYTTTNLMSWCSRLKDASEEDKLVVKNSRGSERANLAVLYLVHQSRQKQSKSVSESYAKDEDVEEDFIHEWAEYEMDKVLGPDKGAAWRASGKVESIPDRLTGDNSRWLKLWLCPQKLVKAVKRSGTSIGVKGESDATAEDVEAIERIKRAKKGIHDLVPTAIQIKKEPDVKQEKTEEAKLEEECKDNEENAAKYIKRMVDIKCDESEWRTKGALNPLAAVLVSNIEKNETSITKTEKILHKVQKGDGFKDIHAKELGIKALNLLIKSVEAHHKCNRDGAITFSIVAGKAKKRKAS